MNLNKKYAVHPGWVRSEFDGNHHWISFEQLVELYKVNPNECFIWDNMTSRGKKQEDYKHLVPRRDGNYSL